MVLRTPYDIDWFGIHRTHDGSEMLDLLVEYDPQFEDKLLVGPHIDDEDPQEGYYPVFEHLKELTVDVENHVDGSQLGETLSGGQLHSLVVQADPISSVSLLGTAEDRDRGGRRPS